MQDQTKMVWPREAILKLVEMWRRNECLYNPRHAFYHNKRARYSAIKKMADNLQGFFPDIGPNEVKNKITYLRGQYTREIARAKERSRSGDDPYVPSVFWFSEMRFLEDFVNKRKGSINVFKPEQVYDSCDSSQLLECNVSPPQACKIGRISTDTPVSSRSLSQENPLIIAKNSPLQSLSLLTNKTINEKDEAFCNYIKMELHEITNINIKDELIEKITLAVFEAKKNQKSYNNDLDKNFANF